METKIGAKEVNEELERVQKTQARMETVDGRKSKSGDTLVFDFEGSVDGELFDGGTAENYELKLGSGQFIPGFEEQLEGYAGGDSVDVKVKFPEDYHAEELAGKDAVFKCKIHEIKEEILPELNDELASDVSEFETLDEFKKDIKKRLQQQAKDRDESMMKDRALEELFNKNEVEAPEVMIQNELENMLYDMNQSLQAQGIGLQQYLEWMGQTPEDLMNQSRPEAEKRIKTRILLKNIIRKEGFTVEDSEVEDLMKEFGAQYGMDVDQVRQMSGSDTESYFKEDALTKKAIDFIFDNAKFKEAKAEKKSKKEDK